MTTKLLDLSGKIDPLSVSLFETLSRAAASIRMPFFVVGATARDIILELGHGVRSKRATKDVDIGVLVNNWEDFFKLKETLLGTGEFTASQEVQRLLYKEKLPLDIMPFGPIEGGRGEISWPPEHDLVMQVYGFDDAFRAAELVRLKGNPSLEVLFASPAGLAIMKIVAWADRPSLRAKDAIDLAHIVETYLDAGNYQRMVDQHSDLFEEDLDYLGAGARLLGRDISRIASAETKARIKAILDEEASVDGKRRLLQAMMTERVVANGEFDKQLEHRLRLLQELRQGISNISAD